MYFPAFYMTKEVVCSDGSLPSKVYERWSENFWPDLFALWKLWVPATAMNFAFSHVDAIRCCVHIFDLDVYPVVCGAGPTRPRRK